jgi:hypothetical protein
MADESLDCCSTPAPVSREMWEAEQIRKWHRRRGKPMPFGALLGAAPPAPPPPPVPPRPSTAAPTTSPVPAGARRGLG